MLPFPLLGSCDNGSESYRPSAALGVSPRSPHPSRPAIRTTVASGAEELGTLPPHLGYWRHTPASRRAANLPSLSPLINLFTPQQKLVSKTQTGAKVTKRYDTAQTPYQRLLAHREALDDIDARALAALRDVTNPAAARREVARLCSTLLVRVRRKTVTARAQTAAMYRSKTKINKPATKRASSDESTNRASRAS